MRYFIYNNEKFCEGSCIGSFSLLTSPLFFIYLFSDIYNEMHICL
ncbi:hypothetical protein EDD80_103117 [Anseongella ginsenosidimutans]|uniref:Uncharacterized protein n=1 Tax=Anseongella ginsenosidimutans TaxID=496056 RepID=A0A4R3KUC1_9SPHI|nr:hypothetical protein EDD80_103117 [Anseongella ginsenosidimutans]